MKTTAYISLIYGLIIILSGIMAFRFTDKLAPLVVEVFLGIVILANVFFMMMEKKPSFYVLLVLSFLLAIFYGYNFSQTHQFFQGVLTGISFFVFIYELLKLFKVTGAE
ncbi:MAG: hypothetical protein KR126chlam4_00142 [Candidatus Anoxychlamydiales bacterium]|nr:hypothetical protein [Candidatus Anoxychlamydiales bacterium]NGX40325.1 hypothetical protein [Candidatus Anoxychlamydiales bacterium]HEU64051.1 hypothetical protein [Chlamydiota bacterium]